MPMKPSRKQIAQKILMAELMLFPFQTQTHLRCLKGDFTVAQQAPQLYDMGKLRRQMLGFLASRMQRDNQAT